MEISDLFLNYNHILPEEDKPLAITFPEFTLPYLDRAKLYNYPEETTTGSTEANTPSWQGWGNYRGQMSTSSTAVTTPMVTTSSLNLTDWNMNKSLNFLRAHALSKSTSNCAAYVWDALSIGLTPKLKNKLKRGHARDVITNHVLEDVGFEPVTEFKLSNSQSTPPNYTPLKGDIAVTKKNSNSLTGHHIAMYDGKNWISDFIQKGLNVYLTAKDWVIYRKIR